jgi:DNA-binding NarL/FixJ family response regulator
MSDSSARTSILIIEHNRILLDGLTRLLSELRDADVAGVATSRSAGLTLFERTHPALTILDLELPGTDAAGLVRRLRQLDANLPILVLATYELDPAAAEAIASGATAIIAKDQIATVLLPLIRGVLSA